MFRDAFSSSFQLSLSPHPPPPLHFKTLDVFLSGDGWGVHGSTDLFDVLLLSPRAIFIVFPINNVIVQMQLLTHICFLKLFVFRRW